MARSIQGSFKYFPLDSSFYENRKIRRLIHSQGTNAIAVWTVIMGMVYANKGYYLPYNDDTLFDIASNCCVTEASVEEIIRACIKIGLFDQEKMDEHKILTSKGIQKQYLDLIKQTKRKTVLFQDFLINSEFIDISSEFISIYSREIAITSEEMQQKKVKENKKKKENSVKEKRTAQVRPNTPKVVKHKHGLYDNVLLTDEQLDKLIESFPDYLERINRLSEYMESKGAKYKNHYATILSWARKDKNARPVKSKFNDFPSRDYNYDELEKILLGR